MFYSKIITKYNVSSSQNEVGQFCIAIYGLFLCAINFSMLTGRCCVGFCLVFVELSLLLGHRAAANGSHGCFFLNLEKPSCQKIDRETGQTHPPQNIRLLMTEHGRMQWFDIMGPMGQFDTLPERIDEHPKSLTLLSILGLTAGIRGLKRGYPWIPIVLVLFESQTHITKSINHQQCNQLNIGALPTGGSPINIH